jgi:magnesium-transporting ATPase (P-type)
MNQPIPRYQTLSPHLWDIILTDVIHDFCMSMEDPQILYHEFFKPTNTIYVERVVLKWFGPFFLTFLILNFRLFERFLLFGLGEHGCSNTVGSILFAFNRYFTGQNSISPFRGIFVTTNGCFNWFASFENKINKPFVAKALEELVSVFPKGTEPKIFSFQSNHYF